MIEPIPFAGLVDVEEPKLKYCSSCTHYRPENTGKIIQTARKNLKRFKCMACLEKISPRLYQGGKK